VFQHDIFPSAYAGKPSVTAEEFFNGVTADPVLVSLESGFETPAVKDVDRSFVPPIPPVIDEMRLKSDKEVASDSSNRFDLLMKC
jgi:hypothetical protein